MPARLLACLTLLASAAPPASAQQAVVQPGADPTQTQRADPALVGMVPASAAGKPFTVAVALGSPPDDFRGEKGEVVGWEIDVFAPRPSRSGSASTCGPPPSKR